MSSDPFFRMVIADVFFIRGRGTIVTGQIEAGTLNTGDDIFLLHVRGGRRAVTVDGIEMFRKQLSEAKAGDNVGLLLRGVQKRDVDPGDALVGG